VQEQLASLTGMPASTIQSIATSIPEIPRLSANSPQGHHYDLESIKEQAVSKNRIAMSDTAYLYSPQVGFDFQYLRHFSDFNDYDKYYSRTLPTNNYSVGISITIPLLDLSHRGKARESAAEALRARIEAEQAQRQNDLNISLLNDNLRELDVLAEIAELKKEIATEQVKSVVIELKESNGSSQSPQVSPRSEQLARIDERQKYIESEDASFDLAKARLNLVKALGHMEEWLKLVESTRPTDPAH
jgi:outer membrane protein TolC